MQVFITSVRLTFGIKFDVKIANKVFTCVRDSYEFGQSISTSERIYIKRPEEKNWGEGEPLYRYLYLSPMGCYWLDIPNHNLHPIKEFIP